MRIRLAVVLAAVAALCLIAPASSLANNGNKSAHRQLPTFTGTVVDQNEVSHTAEVTIKQVAARDGTLYATAYDYNIDNGSQTGSVDPSQSSLALPIGSNRGSQCTILHLDLQPLFLDLLGLQLTTSEIVIDLTAVTGPNNLLGNLLCSLTGIIQPPNGGGGGGLTGLQQLIDNVNAILQQILAGL